MRFVTWILLPVLLLSITPSAAFCEIWGSTKSGSYHLASCRYVKKTWKGYRIKFESARDARAAGYKPCEVCKPPKVASSNPPPPKSPTGSQLIVH